MFTHHRHHETRHPLRAGFTLVEMLVAVALVLIMMTMFAEIFTLATSSMSKQKGLAELDQRQRLMSTLLRDDLRQRSFRNLFAYHPLDNPINILSANRPGNVAFDVRQGYFYISENDPENDGDDVIQWTVTRTDGSLFYGRTAELIDTLGNGASTNPNQPEADDGAAFGEGLGVGTSPSAEVSYFLRNGTLYRRVLLIRRKTDATASDNPSTPGGTPLVQTGTGVYPVATTSPSGYYVYGANGANRYPRDFDYSATHEYVPPPAMSPPPSAPVRILGETESLSNTPVAGIGVSLGQPKNRFGFQRPTGLGGTYPVGLPFEYIGTTFIGRYTHEETSHPAFGYPGDLGAGADLILASGDDTNPYTRTAGLAVSPNGVVTLYADGSREGEDILLTNVQNFDVKVWDPGASLGPDGAYGIAGINDDGLGAVDDAAELGWPGSDDGAFVDIGHTGIGFFSQTNNLNAAYGPAAAGNRCFDTWHADFGPAFMATKISMGYAPFRPALAGYDGAPGKAGVDDDDPDGDPTTGIDDAAELGWPNSDDIPISIKAVQIRVRYLDISSGLVREITIIEQVSPDAI